MQDVATAVLAALDTRAGDGLALNLGERTTATMRAWVEQIITATGADMRLVRVPDEHLPGDLRLLRAAAQHLLVCTQRAQDLLGWAPGDPAPRVVDSVRWHLAHPSDTGWSLADSRADDAALATAEPAPPTAPPG